MIEQGIDDMNETGNYLYPQGEDKKKRMVMDRLSLLTTGKR